MKKSDRRNFLVQSGAFLSTAAAASMTTPGKVAFSKSKNFHKDFRSASILGNDDVNISKDYTYKRLISSTDQISDNEIMGENTDFIAFLPGKSKDHGYLWVNNEALTKTSFGEKRSNRQTKPKSRLSLKKAKWAELTLKS